MQISQFIFLKPPVPINVAVNAIAFGFAVQALEPASRVFFDLAKGNVTNGGFALTGLLLILMISQIILSSVIVYIDLEDRRNIRIFKLLSFLASLAGAISLSLISTITVMKEGNQFYL